MPLGCGATGHGGRAPRAPLEGVGPWPGLDLGDARFRSPTFGKSIASCRSRCSSSAAMMVLPTSSMIAGPPAEPTISFRPRLSNTMVGDIELRGRLPACDAFATGLPSRLGQEGEIRQLVVEQKPVDHDARAELVLDRHGHRHRVAVAIDHREIAGRGQFGRGVVAARSAWRRGGSPGCAGTPLSRSGSISLARDAR